MKKLLITFLIVGFAMAVLSGCGSWQKTVIKVTKMDAANAASTRVAAKQIASTWPLNSSALSVVLTKFSTLLPCDCNEDIKALDDIAAKCILKDAKGITTCEELTDQDMGKVVILWGWTWGNIAKSGVNKIMETFFPSVLAKIMPYVTALGL